MQGWFDMARLTVRRDDGDISPEHVRWAASHIHGVLERLEAEGFASSRIIVAGFSQGGAMSLLSVLSYPRPLAAAGCFGGWLMLKEQRQWALMIHAANRHTPVLWSHGEADPTVLFGTHPDGVARLRAEGVSVATRVHPTLRHSPHEATLIQLVDSVFYGAGIVDGGDAQPHLP